MELRESVQSLIAGLPAALRQQVVSAWQLKDYPSAIRQPEAARVDSDNVFVLASLAASIFEDAVDAVIDLPGNCQRSLQLLAEAKALGLPAGEVQDLEQEIFRVQRGL